MDAIESAAADVRADALLAVRCQLGERAAFDDLIRRWALPLLHHVRRVVGEADAADELVQDIWLGVLQGIGRLQDPMKFRSWMFGIAHRRLMDRLRERYDVRADEAIDPDQLSSADSGQDRVLEARELEHGLQRLPPVEREVLSLFYLDEMPLADVAQALSVPVGTVKSRLFRARALLRHHITGESP